jgi:hypothetical protein
MLTVEVCEKYGLPMLRVRYLLAMGRIKRPEKDASGNYRWGPEAIQELLKAIPPRGRQKVSAGAGEPVTAA